MVSSIVEFVTIQNSDELHSKCLREYGNFMPSLDGTLADVT